jgi:hypothetical protein
MKVSLIKAMLSGKLCKVVYFYNVSVWRTQLKVFGANHIAPLSHLVGLIFTQGPQE